MGLRDRVKKAWQTLFQTRADETISDIISWIESNQGGSTYFKELRTVKDAISRNPYVRRAYEIYLTTIPSLPWQIVNQDGEELENTEFHKVLATPNKFQNWRQFTADTLKWLISTGRFGIRFIASSSGKPVLLWNLDASKLKPRLSNDPLNPIKEFSYGGNAIPTEEIVYDYWPTPNSGYDGESPIESALEEIASSVAIARVVRNLAENNQRPSVIIAPKRDLKDADMTALRKEYDRGSAPDLAGKSFVLPFDATLLKAIISPHEAQLNQTQEAIIKAIFVATGIPRILIEAGEATFENQAQVNRSLYRYALLPVVNKLETSFTGGIVAKYNPEWRFKFDLSGVWALKPEWKEMAEAIPKLLAVLSFNETRAILPGDFEPLLEGGDSIWGGAMNEEKGIAPPVKGKQTKTPKKVKGDVVLKWDELKGIINRDEDLELRPSENFHTCDIDDSGKYTDIKTRKQTSKEYKKQYKVRYGKNKKTNKQGDISFWYDKNVWSVSEARSHCKKHDGSFEAAKKSVKFLEEKHGEYKDAGGFTGTQREIYFIIRKTEFDNYRRRFAQDLAKLYRSQYKRIKEYLEQFDDSLAGLPDVKEWLNWEKERKTFGKMAHPKLVGIFKDAGSKVHEGFEFLLDHKKKIDDYTDKFTERVTDTTINQLEKAIEKELSMRQEDEPEKPEATKKAVLLIAIALIYDNAEGARTNTAAWKETHNAQGFGLTEGMRQEGAAQRQWVSAFAPTSRETHMAADGQIVSLDDTFIVGGEALMWPGDAGGSVENTANCYCTVMVAMEGEE